MHEKVRNVLFRSNMYRSAIFQSGLLKGYANTPPSERLTLVDVEKRVCRYLNKHRISNGILAGAGIAFDRGMVVRS